MSKQESSPPARPTREKGPRRPPPMPDRHAHPKPDPEWEEMKRMLERIADEPDEFETADVPIAAGHMKAAHAEGPMTLHEGIETQPPEARVIIGEATLPTKVLPHPPGKATGWLPRHRWALPLGASALLAVITALVLTRWVFREDRASGGGPHASAVTPSTMGASRRTEDIAPAIPPSPSSTLPVLPAGPVASAWAPASAPVNAAVAPIAPPPAATSSPPPAATPTMLRPHSNHRPISGSPPPAASSHVSPSTPPAASTPSQPTAPNGLLLREF